MTHVAYFDLANGISGDMSLAALAHAGRQIGIDVEKATADAVESLGLDCTVEFVEDVRGGIACVRAVVHTDDKRHTARELREAIEHSDVSTNARTRAFGALEALIAAEARVHGVGPNEVHLHELASSDTAADLLAAAVALETLGVEKVAA